MASEIREQLTKYLTDAHSIEEQALAQLRTAPDLVGDDGLAEAFRTHLAETEIHERTVRELLEQRGASPSRVKDTIMKVGGKGFLLFARLQPDTPGKLVAHALSYEALELASYDLLARVARAAEEPAVAERAEEISDEEQAMMRRLEDGFDRSVAASLRDVAEADLGEQLRKYLADAHAIEEQAIALLERAPALSDDETLAAVYADHLAETRDHAELLAARLHALAGDPSSLKDAALRLGALNWGAFFQAHPDTPGKLAAFAYAFEHLEIGGYEQLQRVAKQAGDVETAELVRRILAEERAAAAAIYGEFDTALQATLAAQGVS
jgi:ferritin-like metal-binding protein YciE